MAIKEMWEKLQEILKSGEITRIIKMAWLEVSEKTESKLDEIEKKEVDNAN